MIGWLLGLLVAAFVVSTLPGVRPEPGFDPWLDGGLQITGYLGAAAYAALRPLRRSDEERTLWALVAVSLGLRALGFVVYVPFIRTMTPQPYPSVADAFWLASSLVLLVALAVRLRVRAPYMSTLLVMDAVAGAVAATAVVLAFLYHPLVDLTASTDAAATATNIAYPVLDVALLVLLAGLLAATRYRPPRSKALLAAGVTTAAVVDFVFLYQVSAGEYRPGTWVAGLSLAGTAVVAAAAHVRDGPDLTVSRRVPGLWLPILFAVVAIGVLVLAAYRPVPSVSVVLAVGVLFVGMTRALNTLVQSREVADQELSEANQQVWRFQTLVETSHDVIAMASPEGRVRYLNPAGRLLLADARPASESQVSVPDVIGRDAWSRLRADLTRQGHADTLASVARPAAEPVPVAVTAFEMRHPDTAEVFAVAVVMRDITERTRAEQAVNDLAEQRRVLLAQLVVAQEDERGRIAADIHDDTVQVLSALDLRLTMLADTVGRDAPQLQEQVESSRAALRAAMLRLRDLMFDLDSPARRSPLSEALCQAARRVFDGTETRWQVDCPQEADLSEELRITAYRIVKEALVNVRRHAGAGRVEVVVRSSDGRLVIAVSDDGEGVQAHDLDPVPGHLGVTSMRNRASAAGGSLAISAGAAGGTEVRVELPL